MSQIGREAKGSFGAARPIADNYGSLNRLRKRTLVQVLLVGRNWQRANEHRLALNLKSRGVTRPCVAGHMEVIVLPRCLSVTGVLVRKVRFSRL